MECMAQPIETITTPNELVNIAHQMFFLEDTFGKLTLNQVLDSNRSATFQVYDKPFVNFGITHSTFWLKFSIRNKTGMPLFIELGNAALDTIELFEMNSDGVQALHKSGSWLQFHRREVKNTNYVFALSVPGDVDKTFFIRVKHSRGTQFSLKAGTLKAFYNENYTINLLIGIYYGMMLLMIFYNLFIYFTLKDNAYLFYVIYVFFMVLLNASLNGHAFQYLWPEHPGLNQYADIIVICLGVSGIFFATSFLRTKQNAPVFHRLFFALYALYFINLIVIGLGYFLVGTILVEIISLVGVLLFFATAYFTLRKGYKPAQFFLIAWTFLLLSAIVFILKDFNIIPYNRLTVNSLQIGSAIEVLLLSVALASRINIYKKETRKAQAEAYNSLEENRRLIAQQNLLLENKVEERTKELKLSNKELATVLENLKLTQAQLIQREKMASLGELTAGVAHEIQNPLNFINNFSEVNLEMTEEMEKEIEQGNWEESKSFTTSIKENIQKVLQHGRRADAIIKGMLQHSRVSTGQMESTDINALADEYLQLCYIAFQSKNKDLNVNLVKGYDISIGKISVVPQDMGRALVNLYNNAFYAVYEKAKTKSTGFIPEVSISTRLMGKNLEIRVKDNGIGIAPELLTKIYQPFFTTKPAGQGTGLGLSLCYDIITKEHGGELSVVAKANESTEFIIRLPINLK